MIASKISRIIAGLIFPLIAACSSGPIVYQINRPGDSQSDVLGKAHGEACGSKVIAMPGALALDFIPIRLSSRLERATEEAIASVPGARRLRNVEIEEHWYWWVLGATRCVVVTGDALK